MACVKKMNKPERKHVEIDGKMYMIMNCPFCNSELKFTLEPVGRRLYCMCTKCKKKLEVTVE